MLLKELPVGDYFVYTDKFDHGFIREYSGQKIGDTITFWSAVRLVNLKDHNPETGIIRMNSNAERFKLMDGRITISNKQPETDSPAQS